MTDSKTSSYLENSLNKLISFLPEDTLKSIKFPNMDTKKDQDIIDVIKIKKGQDPISSIAPPVVDKILDDNN